jgi:hypothetical protein
MQKQKTPRCVCLTLAAISVVARTGPALATSAREDPEITRTTHYAINVDPGSGLSRRKVTGIVADILADPRGWAPLKHTTFAAVAWEKAQLRIWIMEPDEVDRRCAPLTTEGYKSCAIERNVYINADRWKRGAAAAEMAVPDYRRYVVNHEVGHALGEGHRKCPGKGRLAPVMLQQTISLRGCRPNPWPNPGTKSPVVTSSAPRRQTPSLATSETRDSGH